jgi:RNA polymerase sigma factor (sigma-70 family)
MTEATASNPSGGHAGGFALRGPVRLLSDERLVQRAARGDRRAFEEIFRRYHQDLYRFCLATAGNPQDAQDALQNTMVKVMRALPGEERLIRLKPWLYRIARNEAVETVRKRRDNAELETEPTAASWEIAETAEARERLRGLFADLAELPERQRAALVLRELSGLGFDEIGEAFGTTPAVARQTLYEARLSLRQMEEGREMGCETVMRALSDADGRVTRRRDVRAHLRDCASCRSFRDGIASRRGDLAAIAPLPIAVSTGLLHGLLGGQAGAAATAAKSAAGVAAGAGTSSGAGGAGGLAGTISAGAGKVVATSAIAKSAATVAVVTAVGVSAADRSGVIDVPLPGRNSEAAKDASRPAAGSQPQRRDSSRAPAASVSVAGRRGASSAEPAGGKEKNSAIIRQDAKRSATGRAQRSGGPSQASRGTPSGRSRDRATRGNPRGRRVPPQGMPSASNGGQQTAAARKPSPAQPSPGPGNSAKAFPAPPSAPPSKSQGSAATPPPPKATPQNRLFRRRDTRPRRP